MLREVAFALGAFGIGFGCGKAYADAAARPLVIATPTASVVAAFRTLDVCRGDPPASSTIEPIVELGARPTEFSFVYRCPDGTGGRAFQDSPDVDVAP